VPAALCAGLTPAARRLLARVQADPATPALAFMLGGGCCGGTAPVLVDRATILDGFDVPLRDAGGVPLFAHPDHARHLDGDRFVLDVLENARSDTFSLEIAHGGRFVLRPLDGPVGVA
jgi:uncharacterized protein (DUF779 family)